MQITIMECTSCTSCTLVWRQLGLVWRTVHCGTAENPLLWEGGFWKEVLSNIKLAAGAEARQPKEKGDSGYIEQEKKWHKMEKRRTRLKIVLYH